MYINLMNMGISIYDNRVVLLRSKTDYNKNLFLVHDRSGEVGGYVDIK